MQEGTHAEREKGRKKGGAKGHSPPLFSRIGEERWQNWKGAATGIDETGEEREKLGGEGWREERGKRRW